MFWEMILVGLDVVGGGVWESGEDKCIVRLCFIVLVI